MPFLTDDDYKAQIKDSILNTILENTQSIRSNAERKAQEQMTSALNVRYDVPAIFAKTGVDRNEEVIMYMIDLVLYHVHSRINPGQVPKLRDDRYVDAKDWLNKVASGKLEPNLPKPAGADTGIKYDVQYGSQKPRNPYY